MAVGTQFLYRLTPTRAAMLSDAPTDREAETVARHFAYLEDLTRAGVVHLAGRTDTADAETFGIVVFSAKDEKEARERMLADPAVRDGVMNAVLYPFRVALWSAMDEEARR